MEMVMVVVRMWVGMGRPLQGHLWVMDDRGATFQGVVDRNHRARTELLLDEAEVNGVARWLLQVAADGCGCTQS